MGLLSWPYPHHTSRHPCPPSSSLRKAREPTHSPRGRGWRSRCWGWLRLASCQPGSMCSSPATLPPCRGVSVPLPCGTACGRSNSGHSVVSCSPSSRGAWKPRGAITGVPTSRADVRKSSAAGWNQVRETRLSLLPFSQACSFLAGGESQRAPSDRGPQPFVGRLYQINWTSSGRGWSKSKPA